MAEPQQGQGNQPQGGAPAAGAPASGQPAGQPAGGQPAGGGAPAAAQPTYPWQQDPRFKEKGPEDIWNSYRGAEQQLGQYGQYKQFADQVNQLAQQWGGLDNLLALAQFGANAYRERQAQPQGGAQQPSAWDQVVQRWEELTPQQQAGALYQQIQSQVQPYGQQLATELRTQLQQEIQQALGGVQRQWDIFQRLLSKKMQNPDLPMEDTLQQMVQLAQSDPQKLMDLAINNLTLEQQIKQKADAIAQARIADYEREQKNKTLQSLTSVRPNTQGGSGPAPRNSAERRNHVLSTLLEKGMIGSDQI